jgi:hypothetical protein
MSIQPRLSAANPTTAARGSFAADADGRPMAFARLQERMAAVEAARGAGLGRRSVVVLPYGKVGTWRETPAERQAYEERLLCSLFDLSDPNLHMTYVTSAPIDSRIIDYYLSLLPRGVIRTARRRLTLIAVGDCSRRPLSEKLLERPAVLSAIRRAIPEPRLSHLAPYNSAGRERELALALDIPMFAGDPRHGHLGTKSGGRELFVRAGVPCPLGAERLSGVAGAIAAIVRMRAAKPNLRELVMKLEEGVSGQGNAFIDLEGLPAPGAPDEAERIAQRVGSLAPAARGVSAEAYLAELSGQGGVVEESIAARELRSPSAQLQITPFGQVELLSTHDQILTGPGGQRYIGCRFPADPSYALAIGALACRVARVLANDGVIGRCAIDFVLARGDDDRWEPFAIELNLRKGGTTHPYEILRGLVEGRYHTASATFTTPTGRPKHYVATDYLEDPKLRALGRDGVLGLIRQGDLRFDRRRRTGTVFHMLSSLDELGRVGFTAIGNSPEEADARFGHVKASLMRHANACGLRNTRRAVKPVSRLASAPA